MFQGNKEIVMIEEESGFMIYYLFNYITSLFVWKLFDIIFSGTFMVKRWFKFIY